jgi:hypothetical protein
LAATGRGRWSWGQRSGGWRLAWTRHEESFNTRDDALARTVEGRDATRHAIYLVLSGRNVSLRYHAILADNWNDITVEPPCADSKANHQRGEDHERQQQLNQEHDACDLPSSV